MQGECFKRLVPFAGAQLATYACSADRGPADEVVTQVSMAAASAAAASAAGCNIGIQVDGAGDANMELSTALTSIMASSFDETQQCECGGAGAVFQFPAESMMAQALQTVKPQDVSDLDNNGAKTYVEQLSASLSASLSSIVESVTVYADDNCRPGSGGVLDQSFACGELSAGNETEMAYAVGARSLQCITVSCAACT